MDELSPITTSWSYYHGPLILFAMAHWGNGILHRWPPKSRRNASLHGWKPNLWELVAGAETASYENGGGSSFLGLGGKKTYFWGFPILGNAQLEYNVGKAIGNLPSPNWPSWYIFMSGMKHQSIWVVCGIALPTLAHLQLGYKPCLSHGNITYNWGVL